MLGKLIKHELNATKRFFFPMYLTCIVISIIAGVLFAITSIGSAPQNDLAIFFASLLGMLLYLFAYGVFFATFILIILRFYRMLGDEGYLMFTLPVTTHQLILSKLISGVIWSIGSTLFIFLSLLIAFSGALFAFGGLSTEELFSDFGNFAVEMSEITFVFIFVLIAIVFLLVCTVLGILTYYAPISIGPSLAKSRLGGTVLAHIIISIGSSILYIVVFFILGLVITTFDLSEDEMGVALVVLMALILILSTLIFYFITYYPLKNKLNLA